MEASRHAFESRTHLRRRRVWSSVLGRACAALGGKGVHCTIRAVMQNVKE
jgi:hypothetical protein